MNQKDQVKVLKAGFTILRIEITPINNSIDYTRKIKYKNDGNREWRTYESGFPSNAALNKRMKELLEDEKMIED